jgi:hypothetical protein
MSSTTSGWPPCSGPVASTVVRERSFPSILAVEAVSDDCTIDQHQTDGEDETEQVRKGSPAGTLSYVRRLGPGNIIRALD